MKFLNLKDFSKNLLCIMLHIFRSSIKNFGHFSDTADPYVSVGPTAVLDSCICVSSLSLFKLSKASCLASSL
jgi:hypothetical protein